MEDAFNKIRGQKKNNVDNLVQWMKDSKIVKEETTEDNLRKMFSDVKDEADVDMASFKSALQKLSKEQKTSMEEFTEKLGQQAMEAAFEKLKKNQKNTVDNLIQWMKESKLIDDSKETEGKARALFADVKDKSNVEYDSFKTAVTKIAEEQKKKFEEAFKSLTAEGPKLLSAAQEGFSKALGAGASAFKDAFAKK